jgi:hypothetical protein
VSRFAASLGSQLCSGLRSQLLHSEALGRGSLEFAGRSDECFFSQRPDDIIEIFFFFNLH